jgi:MFS family permease
MVSDEFAADARSYGVLASLMAIGSLTAALVQARRSRTGLRQVWLSAGCAGLAATLAGLMPTVATFAAALVACGAAALTMMTSANAYLQTHTDSEHRSRVMALYLAVFFGTTPVGAPLIGTLADTLGPRAALVIPGLVSIAVTVALVLAHCWSRQHQTRRGPGGGTADPVRIDPDFSDSDGSPGDHRPRAVDRR